MASEYWESAYCRNSFWLHSLPGSRGALLGVRFSVEPERPASDGLELVQVRVATSWDA
jgi:hypothetical protein